MQLIVGLGNPKKQYKNTRHNIGMRVVNALRQTLGFPAWHHDPPRNAQTSIGTVAGITVVLAKPTVFMNDSGVSVAALQRRTGVTVNDIIIIHDDADIALGTVKLERTRGSGGHHGVESVIEHLGTNAFWRLRYGIRTTERDTSNLRDFALKPFRPDEHETVEQMITDAVKQLKTRILPARL